MHDRIYYTLGKGDPVRIKDLRKTPVEDGYKFLLIMNREAEEIRERTKR